MKNRPKTRQLKLVTSQLSSKKLKATTHTHSTILYIITKWLTKPNTSLNPHVARMKMKMVSGKLMMAMVVMAMKKKTTEQWSGQPL